MFTLLPKICLQSVMIIKKHAEIFNFPKRMRRKHSWWGCVIFIYKDLVGKIACNFFFNSFFKTKINPAFN
jgi:hypothetical protein